MKKNKEENLGKDTIVEENLENTSKGVSRKSKLLNPMVLICAFIALLITICCMITLTKIAYEYIDKAASYVKVTAIYEGEMESLDGKSSLLYPTTMDNFSFEYNGEIYSAYRYNAVLYKYEIGDKVTIKCNPQNPVEIEENELVIICLLGAITHFLTCITIVGMYIFTKYGFRYSKEKQIKALYRIIKITCATFIVMSTGSTLSYGFISADTELLGILRYIIVVVLVYSLYQFTCIVKLSKNCAIENVQSETDKEEV